MNVADVLSICTSINLMLKACNYLCNINCRVSTYINQLVLERSNTPKPFNTTCHASYDQIYNRFSELKC